MIKNCCVSVLGVRGSCFGVRKPILVFLNAIDHLFWSFSISISFLFFFIFYFILFLKFEICGECELEEGQERGGADRPIAGTEECAKAEI